MRALIPVCLLAATLALTGCTNPDAPSTARSTQSSASVGNPGEPAAPPPPSPSAQAPTDVRPTPAKALAAFAQLYVNWSYRTLSADQGTLAAISVGAARLSERQAAASSRGDTTIAAGHIWNSGEVISIARDLASAGAWVIVTRERTGGNTQYEGLPAAYHVTIAALANVPGGYAVSQWQPQS
jgi:hypothetical protein